MDGQLIQGTQNIFFAQLADPDVEKFYEGTSRFMSGRFITMMFGLLGAGLAIYHTAKPKNKKLVGGLMLSAGLTSFFTGITEPLEFSFLFVAPILYVIHAVYDGLAFMMADLFSITIGQTFSGGFIDYILFGVLQGNDKTNFLYVIPIGIVWFLLYYITFRFMITKMKLKTPGREEKDMSQQVNASEKTMALAKGLGGGDNIEEFDNCATRLRITLKDIEQIDEDTINSTGPNGIVKKGNGVQVIYGPQVSNIKNDLEEYLNQENNQEKDND